MLMPFVEYSVMLEIENVFSRLEGIRMKPNLHEMVGKEYTHDDLMKVCLETNVNPLKVDFRLICELIDENPDMDYGLLIAHLEMNDIPMTDAVRKLGICAGVLYA